MAKQNNSNEGQAENSEEKKTADLEVNKDAFINVSVATLWTKPDLNRPVDEASISNPTDIRKWTETMTVDEKKGLVGNLQTQALYGDTVKVMDLEDGWAKVAVYEQPTAEDDTGYVAWLPTKQLVYEASYESQRETNPFIVVTESTAQVYNDEDMQELFMEVSYNTRLPVIKEMDNRVLIETPDDGEKWVSSESLTVYENEDKIPKPTGDTLVQSGKQFIDTPYLWAGASGFGFDCSGFTYSLFKTNGITIPRDASVQATHGKAVDKQDLQKGDLLFFADDNGEGTVHHVGMYIDNGEIIHAPNSDRAVEIINVFKSDYWSNEYAGSRRYIDD